MFRVFHLPGSGKREAAGPNAVDFSVPGKWNQKFFSENAPTASAASGFDSPDRIDGRACAFESRLSQARQSLFKAANCRKNPHWLAVFAYWVCTAGRERGCPRAVPKAARKN
jgi:hypothetical protein